MELVARAPTRLDFGGGWTDVPPYSDEQGGFVCSVALGLHAVATVRDGAGAGDAAADDGARDLAITRAAIRRAGLTNVRVDIESRFPVGAGLGGSSAASVAALGALAAFQGRPIDPAALAESSRQMEVEDLGIAGGRQDHYAAAVGGALGLRFGDDGVDVGRIPLDARVIADLEARCIVAYTGTSRISGDTITAVMDGYRAGDRRTNESLGRMRELAVAMAAALAGGDLDALGRLVGEHWVFQRSLHPAIPTPAIDAILDAALAAGAHGGKALGASGGGCVMALAARGREAAVRDAMGAQAALLPVRVSRTGFEVLAATPGVPE